MENRDNMLLEIRDLKVHFFLDEGVIRAVDGVSFNVRRGQTLGVIGESGCGKSVTAQSVLRILPTPPAKIINGNILFHRQTESGIETVDLTTLSPDGKKIRDIRGKDISMVFQEPMTSFGPLNTIGDQIMETIMIHEKVSRQEARDRTIDLLRRVGIPKAEQRVDAYPHQFSGGMRQRAMIAMALSCSPQLLIADEPTTALDVTVEAQILELLRELQEATKMSIILITHNLAVVSEVAEEIIVMYLGRVVEHASTSDIFDSPMHPYTQGLWRSIPKLDGEISELIPIKGVVPSPHQIPKGCVFYPRCEEYMPGVCDRNEFPPSIEVSPGHWVSCFKYA